MTGLTHTDESKNNKLRLLFYASWLLLSLLQAAFTELRHDEAYYWKYSQHLAWGYFDHPPVIALMIKAGYTLFQNELGVRLLSVLFSTAFLYVLERLVQPTRIGLYYMSILSIGILHFVGVMAVPDVPLLLFTASFFYLYRLYLKQDRLHLTLLIALNIALLLLSKYHGILLIVFTIASNTSILKRRSFWLIASLSLLLFFPHIFWQWNNGFPSIKYHLYERSPLAYRFGNTSEYLLILLLIFGPFTGALLLFMGLKSKVHDPFEKAMKFNLAGILLFFAAMTFNGRTEGNWILFAVVPAVYLGYRKVELKNWYVGFAKYSFGITVFIVVVARWYLMGYLWPKQWEIASDYKGWKQWAIDMKSATKGKPVAFMNSYQNASLYEFYSGVRSFSLDNVMGRKNQYSIWNYEDKLQGEDVAVVTNTYIDQIPFAATAKGNYQFAIIPNFRTPSNVRIHTAQNEVSVRSTQSFNLSFSLSTLPGSNVDANANEQYRFHLEYLFFDKDGFVSQTKTPITITNSMLKHCGPYTVNITPPTKPGEYYLRLAVAAGWLPPSINMGRIDVQVN